MENITEEPVKINQVNYGGYDLGSLTRNQRAIAIYIIDNKNELEKAIITSDSADRFIVRGIWKQVRSRTARAIIKALDLREIPGYKMVNYPGPGAFGYVFPDQLQQYGYKLTNRDKK